MMCSKSGKNTTGPLNLPLPYEALADELAGVFLFNIQRNDEDQSKAASVYLLRAVHLFRTWGAATKVKDLYVRYSNAL
jgi:hypothetical protein